VVEHFHRLGMPVHVWTVDAEDDMRALLAMGVGGIVTDRPDVLARVLGRRPRA
jgi:glycerophosphoryl diester phosphodiesterase